MQLFLFLIGKKIKQFCSLSNGLNILYSFYYFTFLLISAYVSSKIYNFDIINGKDTFPLVGLVIFSITILILPTLNKFFPTFSPKINKFENYLPLTKLQRVFLDLIYWGLTKSFYLYVFMGILFFKFECYQCTTYEVVYLFLLALCGFLLSENLLNAISWMNKSYITVLLLTILAFIIYFIKFIAIEPLVINSILIIMVFLLLLFYYYFYNVKHITIKKNKKTVFILTPILKKMPVILQILTIKNNMFYRSVLNVSVVIKIIVLLLFFETANNKNINGFPDNIGMIFFISPILLFTYIYNNVWGFFKSVAINFVLSGTSIKDYFIQYLRLILNPILIDIVITFLILSFFNYSSINIFSCYLVLSVYFITVGFLSSLGVYREIQKNVQINTIKSNTSQIAGIISTLPIIGLYFFYGTNKYLYLYLFLLLFFSLLLMIYCSRKKMWLVINFRNKLFANANTN